MRNMTINAEKLQKLLRKEMDRGPLCHGASAADLNIHANEVLPLHSKRQKVLGAGEPCSSAAANHHADLQPEAAQTRACQSVLIDRHCYMHLAARGAAAPTAI